MDRAQKKPVEFQLNRSAFAMRPRHSNITADHFTAWALFLSIDACRTLLDSGSGFWILDSTPWIPESLSVELGFRIPVARDSGINELYSIIRLSS